jgi:predicted DNA-binding helix-hairpin-helix protein
MPTWRIAYTWPPLQRAEFPYLRLCKLPCAIKTVFTVSLEGAEMKLPRIYIPPDQLARSFMELYRKGKVKGLFLSSGIFGHPEFTMEKMIDTVKILREKYRFNGYVHLKLMPGVSLQTVEEAVKVADRVSINIETSKEERLKRIAKGKSILQDILPKIEAVG